MKKILIHIGYPKTATTTLQDNLFTKLDEAGFINYLGKYYKEKTKVNSQILFNKLIWDKTSTKLEKEINKLIKIQKNNNKLTVLSNEELVISFLDNIDNTFIKYINPFKVCDRIKEMFQNIYDDLEILISIRAQKDIVYTYYVEQYKWKFRKIKSLDTFKKYLYSGLKKKKQGNFLMFYYDDIYTYYVNVFGKDKIHLLLYEDLLYDTEFYFKKLSEILQVDKNIVAKCLTTPKNRKKTDRKGNYLVEDIELGLEIRFFLTKLEKYKGFLTLKKNFYDDNKLLKQIYRSLIMSSFNKIKIKKNKVILKPTEEEIELIINEFSNTNQKLAEKANLDKNKLIKYGYWKEKL